MATYQQLVTKHEQSNHEGLIFICDQCDYMYKTQHSLKKHQQSRHEGVSKLSSLKTHRQYSRKGVRYRDLWIEGERYKDDCVLTDFKMENKSCPNTDNDNDSIE